MQAVDASIAARVTVPPGAGTAASEADAMTRTIAVDCARRRLWCKG